MTCAMTGYNQVSIGTSNKIFARHDVDAILCNSGAVNDAKLAPHCYGGDLFLYLLDGLQPNKNPSYLFRC